MGVRRCKRADLACLLGGTPRSSSRSEEFSVAKCTNRGLASSEVVKEPVSLPSLLHDTEFRPAARQWKPLNQRVEAKVLLT